MLISILTDFTNTYSLQTLHARTSGVADQEDAKCKQNDGPFNDEVELVKEGVLATPFEREHEGHAHYPYKPREHKVSHRQSVPLAVLEEVVAPTTVVHKDHDH